MNVYLCAQATKNKDEQSFYSLPEFEEWKAARENWHTYKIKYYKGVYYFFLLIFNFRENWHTYKIKYYKGARLFFCLFSSLSACIKEFQVLQKCGIFSLIQPLNPQWSIIDHWGFKGPRGFRGPRFQKFKKPRIENDGPNTHPKFQHSSSIFRGPPPQGAP